MKWFELSSSDSKEVWHFPCQQWLALGEGRRGDGGGGGSEDGSGEGVEVELVVGEKKGGASNKESGMYVHTYIHVHTFTYMYINSRWLPFFYGSLKIFTSLSSCTYTCTCDMCLRSQTNSHFTTLHTSYIQCTCIL